MSQNSDDPSHRDHAEAIIVEKSLVAAPSANADALLGKTIDGRFLIQSVIGIGGMATAYKAKQIDLDRIVVIKVLRGPTDQEGLRRFQREALVLSKLDAPGIVKIFTFGISDGQPYMAMDLIEGESLADLIKRVGALQYHQILSISIQLCDALQQAHAAGILHRDIKPSNIMIQSTGNAEKLSFKAQLLDFGIAKITGAQNSTLTSEGDIFGSPPYMSPEQCYGKEADARSDIYSLACTIFEMVTGKPPYAGSSPAEILLKHCNEKVPSFRDRNRHTQSTLELEKIVQKCLNKEATLRYPDMKSLKTDLLELESNTATTSLSPAKPAKEFRLNWRRLTVIAASLCASIAMLSILGGMHFWEFMLNLEEQSGMSFLIAPTESLIEQSLISQDRSTESCKKLMARLTKLQKRNKVYRVALPSTLHYVAAHADKLTYKELAQLNEQACLFCLDVAKLKQEFDLGTVPADLYLLAKNAGGQGEDKTIGSAESAFMFLWRPLYVFCQFKMKAHPDKQFAELANKQFDLVPPSFQHLLKLLAKTEPSLAKSHLQFVFSHLVECQAVMGEAYARTLAAAIIKELPANLMAQHLGAKFAFANGLPIELLNPEQCKAYFPIALHLYKLSQTDESLQDEILTQSFFRNIVIGAVEQEEKPEDLLELEKILQADTSDKWINAVNVNLTDAKPLRYRIFWSRQARQLIKDQRLNLQPRQEALIWIGLCLERIESGEDFDAARQYYRRAVEILAANPKLNNARTRIVFRLLVLNAYLTFHDGDKKASLACIEKFIPQMPNRPEPYLIQSIQMKLKQLLLIPDNHTMLLKLMERKLQKEAKYSEYNEIMPMVDRLTRD